VPKEIVDTGTCTSAALRAAVNDPRGWSSAPGPPFAGGADERLRERLDRLQRREDRVAGGGGLGELQPVDRALDRLPVGGG